MPREVNPHLQGFSRSYTTYGNTHLRAERAVNDLLYQLFAHPQASSSARLGRSWHTYILRHHAQVLGRLGLLDTQHSHTALAPSCLARRDDAASWAKGFQNVAAPLHMFEALGGYDVEERLSLSLKQKTTRKRGINLNGDPRGLDLFKTCFSTASTIMFLECRESMSFGRETTREREARRRITR